MRDLVETVIGQVLKQKPTMNPIQNQETFSEAKPSFFKAHVNKEVTIKDMEIWDACCQFESVFLQQMMQAMRKTVPESEFLPRGYANDMYDSMMDQAISESGSKKAPLGLAANMYRQLERDGFTQGSESKAQVMQQISDTMKTDFSTKPPHLGGSNG